MGDMLQQMIEQRIGQRPLFLHGGCSIKQCQEMVERFQQNSRSNQIFLLSLKAAGTGLNLTAASGESWIGKLSNSELREFFR